ncbi:MAG: PQQ-dependent sugar dehydrogenase [Ignavibacteriaceae bacterium]
MLIRNWLLLITIALMFSSPIIAQYTYEEAFPNLPNLSGPVDLRNSGDFTNRLFVVEQPGRIKVFENRPDVNSIKTFLNIEDSVLSGGELGLLGLAFHPDYKNNGYFYVNYTASNPRRTIIARFQVSSTNADSAAADTKFELLTYNQPYTNHNGGWIGFGPDGYLYIAAGDGGSGGDPDNYAQNVNFLLGKILRIDVDNQDPGLNYAIPPDNPFVDSTGTVRKEIFAWGMRNPWRCSFDPVTGWLWAADVGQGAREEVDIVENGGNYGWRCYEGNLPYNTTGCLPPENYIFPIWDYPRSEGYSVTGGYVYRGPNQPDLVGKYIYADWGSRRVWSLDHDGVIPTLNVLLFTLPSGASPTSFGIDEAGELYFVGGSRIRKITPTAPVIAPSALTLEVTQPLVIELNWFDNSNNEDGFIIERMDDGGSYNQIAAVGSNITTYVDNVTQALDYKYRVKAYNASDTSGYTNEVYVNASVVPVELSLFTVEISRDKRSVNLFWETSSELNNRGFEIERSLPLPITNEEGDYVTIGFVEGNGTTTNQSVYTFSDNFGTQSFSGTAKYRLKQIDFDGSFSYSASVAVELDLLQKDYAIEQNFPNPFNPTTSIRFYVPEESSISVQVMNTLGEVITSLVSDVKPAGVYTESWNPDNVATGVYYVRMKAESLVSGNTFSETIKVVYLK